ncbi:MAG: signal peptidase II [Pseudomonadota bacterium]
MSSRYVSLLIITTCVVTLDQLTKLWVSATMRLGESRPLIDGLLNLTYVQNSGVAFGMLAGRNMSAYVFVFISLVALVLILGFMRQITEREKLLSLALALVFSGAIGNVIDRLRVGEVIDFIDVHVGSYHWFFFNVADSAITVGGLLLAAHLLRRYP